MAHIPRPAAPDACDDTKDPPNLNTGDEWTQSEIDDIAWGVKHKDSVAGLLCRTRREIIGKVAELRLFSPADLSGAPRPQKRKRD